VNTVHVLQLVCCIFYHTLYNNNRATISLWKGSNHHIDGSVALPSLHLHSAGHISKFFSRVSLMRVVIN
jgi:hypothetical protein